MNRLILLLPLLLCALPAYAELTNALQADSFQGLLTDILNAVIQIGSIILIVALVWTGFLFVTASGNEEKVKEARQAFFWCVIGGLLLLGATAIQLAIAGFIEAL